MMQPETEAQVADAIRDAKSALKIRGGGTRPIGNPVTGEVLSMARLSGIMLYEPGALTIVAHAGTPLAEIEAALAKENQRLPFEPMHHHALLRRSGDSTIGGAVAANVSGPRRIQAGACRDSLIGVRFVDGQGNTLKNGGRVMKNVTGYDLVKLMAGSYGTLGVLTEVSFKILPATEAQAVLIIYGQSVTASVATMSQALGSPFEVSGAAFAAGRTLLRIEGFAESVTYRTARLQELLKDTGDITVETDPEAVAALWRDIGDVADFAEHDSDVWRVSVKPSDAPEFVAALDGSQTMLDWGGGLIWVACSHGTDLRSIAPQIAGHRTLIRADDATKLRLGTFQPEADAIKGINDGLRTKFDPRGILNPGLMT